MSKTLRYETNLLEYGEVNEGFAKVKISIMTDQQVANNTKFTRECIDKQRNGLNYLPVVAEFKKDDNDFGTHGGKLEISDDGFEYIDTTKPYGVVIANSSRWEDVKLKNGETVPYLCADAYLWIDRYPELNCLYEGKLNNQSMEIQVKSGKFNEDTWVYEVDDFNFSALCLLGKTISPAFHEAKVDVNYTQNDFKADYQSMMDALDKYLSKYAKSEVNTVTEKDTTFEEEATIEAPVEDTEIVETTEEEVVETPVEEEVVEVEEEDTDEVVESDDEQSTEEEPVEEVVNEEEEVVEEEEEKVDYQELFTELQAKFDALTVECDDLRTYKSQIEKQQKLSKIDGFKQQLTDEDLAPVYSVVDSKTIEELETMCFAILGKQKASANFSKQETGYTRVANIEATTGMTSGSWLDMLAQQ